MSAENTDNLEESDDAVGGMPIRSSKDEFDSSEMLECQDCHRKTPPNRLDCLYCGAPLRIREEDEKLLRPVLRSPDSEESGYNLIVLPSSTSPWTSELIALAASMARIEKAQVRQLCESSCAVPLARAESRESVDIAAKRLSEGGAIVNIIHDGVFEPDKPQTRLRSINQTDEGDLALIHFNNDEIRRISRKEVVLIVTGLVIENRVEAKEKHKRKGPEKVLQSTEVSSDEVVIDIYLADSTKAYRVQGSGFDFSFLGTDKEMLVARNLDNTISMLRQFAPAAVFCDQYRRLRSALGAVWTIEERKDTKSIKRHGFGSVQKQLVVSSSNNAQFTMFSRLQWLIRFQESEVKDSNGN